MLPGRKISVIVVICIMLFLLPACEKEQTVISTSSNTEIENMRDGDGSIRSYTQITQEEAKKMIASDTSAVIVDVRRIDEYEAGHIPGAILIPNEDIIDEMPEELPDLEQTILIYCRSGRRSKEAAQKLIEIGYSRIYEFGGIIDWTDETVVGNEP